MSAARDQADIDRVLAGETDAFEGIVRRWQGPLVNLAYRFCRDRSRAEEMAQEAFLRAYRSLPKWRREAAFSTWLFALATNLFSSELRRFPMKMVSLDDIPDPPHAYTPEGPLQQQDQDRALRAALYTLPAKYRETLILFYYHEMDVSAAALSLGIPEGTVKARLSRGREILRARLSRRRPALVLRKEG